jgi:hypothetical protein
MAKDARRKRSRDTLEAIEGWLWLVPWCVDQAGMQDSSSRE